MIEAVLRYISNFSTSQPPVATVGWGGVTVKMTSETSLVTPKTPAKCE